MVAIAEEGVCDGLAPVFTLQQEAGCVCEGSAVDLEKRWHFCTRVDIYSALYTRPIGSLQYITCACR